MYKKLYSLTVVLFANLLVQAESPESACVKRMNTLAHTMVQGPKDEKPTGLESLFRENLPEQEQLTFKKIHAEYTKQAGKKARSLSEMLDVSEQWCHRQQQDGASRAAIVLHDARVDNDKTFLERHASLGAVGGIAMLGALAGWIVLSEWTGVPVLYLPGALKSTANEYKSYSIFGILFWPFKSENRIVV